MVTATASPMITPMADRDRSRHLSLRTRLVVLASVAVLLVLVIGGGLLLVGLRQTLTGSVETTARARLESTALLAQSDDLPTTIPLANEEDTLVQIIAADGSVIASSSNIEGEDALLSTPVPEGESRTFSVREPPIDDDHPARVVAVGVRNSSGDPITVLVGQSLEGVDEAVRTATRLGAFGLPVLVLGLAFISWILVGRALRPVEAVRREADEIGGSDLHRRVPVPPQMDEVGLLATTINSMLERLEESALRQDRFVGDAAHELRSPIASLRAQLETARASSRPVDWADVSTDLWDETLRMQELTEQLLLLTRVDGQRSRIARIAVDLDDIAEIQMAAARALGGDVTIRSLVQPVQVMGDPVLLSQLVRNLLENALRHASSMVTVAVHVRGDDAVLSVSDDGAGIPAADRGRVFERFVRLDDARSRGAGGTGLGLAIVADIAAAHQGSIRVTDDGPGATFELRLPTGDGQ